MSFLLAELCLDLLMGTRFCFQLFDNGTFDARCRNERTLFNLAVSPFFKIPPSYTPRRIPCLCVFTLLFRSTLGFPVEKKRAWEQGQMKRKSQFSNGRFASESSILSGCLLWSLVSGFDRFIASSFQQVLFAVG